MKTVSPHFTAVDLLDYVQAVESRAEECRKCMRQLRPPSQPVSSGTRSQHHSIRLRHKNGAVFTFLPAVPADSSPDSAPHKRKLGP